MSIITKASAKNYFLTGLFPTQAQFADTIDSYLGLGESGSQTIPSPIAFTSPTTFGGAITVSGDVTATGGRVTASAATITSLLTGNTASFSGIVSAASLNVTGDVQAATGKITASAANITALLTGVTASFSSIVSAATVNTNNLIINGTSIVSAKGTTSIVATVSGAVTSAHLAAWDTSGNLVDGGAAPTAGALTLLSAQTASNSAQIDFDSLFTSTYVDYILEFNAITCTNSGRSFQFLASTNNGVSFDTGSNYTGQYSEMAAGTVTGGAGGGTTFSPVGSLDTNSTPISGTLKISNVGGSAKFISQFTDGTNLWMFSGSYIGGTMNALRFNFNANNISSGTIKLYGMQKS